MKRNELLCTALRMCFMSLAASGLASAQAVDGSSGVDLGNTGEVLNAGPITYPDSVTSGNGLSWEFSQAMQGFMVPAGQLTGLKPDGTALNFEDLLPLKATKISIASGAAGQAPTGFGTVIDGNGISANAIKLLGTDASGNSSLVPLTVSNGVLNVGNSPVSAGLSTSNVTVGNGLILSNGVISLDSSVMANIYNSDGTIYGNRYVTTGNAGRLILTNTGANYNGVDSSETALAFKMWGAPANRYGAGASIDMGAYGNGADPLWASSYLKFVLDQATDGDRWAQPLTLSAQGGGRVGVGVHQPNSKLEVNGSIRISDDGTQAFGVFRYNNSIGRFEGYCNDVNGDGTQGDAGWRPL